MSLGIGIITYNRAECATSALDAIKAFTTSDYYLVLADDGSQDDTVACCQQAGVTAITGANQGVCWNKNRALYTLMQHTDADPIILLEDDCYPNQLGWQNAWITAVRGFHHVNYALPSWSKKAFRLGHGTPTNPWLSYRLTGQATISTRDSLKKIGYLNTRFKGYGYGHIEWTWRFCNAGFIRRTRFPCINSGLTLRDNGSFYNKREVRHNLRVFYQLRRHKKNYFDPWQNADEKALLEAEVAAGLSNVPLKLIAYQEQLNELRVEPLLR